MINLGKPLWNSFCLPIHSTGKNHSHVSFSIFCFALTQTLGWARLCTLARPLFLSLCLSWILKVISKKKEKKKKNPLTKKHPNIQSSMGKEILIDTCLRNRMICFYLTLDQVCFQLQKRTTNILELIITLILAEVSLSLSSREDERSVRGRHFFRFFFFPHCCIPST